MWGCWAGGGCGATRRLKKASLLGIRLGKETTISEANKVLGRREIEEIFNGSNLDAADEIYASNLVDHDRAFFWEMHGPEEMKEYVGIYHSAFPGFRVTLEDQVAEGDKVVNRWKVQGTHPGEFQGVTPHR